MKVLSALAADAQQGLQRLIVCACLALAALVSGAIGLGFATYALFLLMLVQYGLIAAAVALAVVYFVVAALFYLLYRRASRRTSVREARERLSAAADTATAPQAAAMAAGLELAKQMSPLQLALLAAISGFVAGRRL
jgi:hypothetical protein